MDGNYLIIPDYNDKEEYAAFAKENGVAFEYNDFCTPSVYSDPEEVERRIEGYLSLGRDTSKDTLHGVFLDIVPTSQDKYIRDYSREKMRQSMDIAARLSAKGVVFHSALLKGLDVESYLSAWENGTVNWFRELASEFPKVEIYLENTLESHPTQLVNVAKRLAEVPNFGLCLDYAHANISGAKDEFIKEMLPYVKHLHINDNDGKVDLHQPVGAGTIDWKAFEKEMRPVRDKSMLIELKGLVGIRQSLKALQEINAYKC